MIRIMVIFFPRNPEIKPSIYQQIILFGILTFEEMQTQVQETCQSLQPVWPFGMQTIKRIKI